MRTHQKKLQFLSQQQINFIWRIVFEFDPLKNTQEKMAAADHKAIFGTSNIKSHQDDLNWGKQTFHDIYTFTESYNLLKHFMYLAIQNLIESTQINSQIRILYTFNAFSPYYEFFKMHPPFNRQSQTQIIRSIKNTIIVQGFQKIFTCTYGQKSKSRDKQLIIEVNLLIVIHSIEYYFKKLFIEILKFMNLHMKGQIFDKKQLFYTLFNNDRLMNLKFLQKMKIKLKYLWIFIITLKQDVDNKKTDAFFKRD
ncbi:unnamed protein product [Paramecium sonneborni]|uniref:Uncharacterized protein n=1 Tax=Paramecium sonneborni TaxID=65129 RepID=A0A8S1QZR4_9CILI|nr:unnamed protein product [Paramecium sonneborni]